MIRKIFSLVLSVAIMIIGISGNVQASSAKIQLTEEMRCELVKNLDELNVSKEAQPGLIAKLENGELWDCMKDENIAAFTNMEFEFSPDNSVKRMVFEDGSVLEQAVDFENATIERSFSRGEGSMQAYSAMRTTFRDVQISASNGLSGGGFYADYVLDFSAHNDGIISVRDPYCNVLGGDYKDMSVTINRSYENYSKKKPAEATYSVHVTYLANIGGAETFIIKMYVGNDKLVYGKLGEVSFSY